MLQQAKTKFVPAAQSLHKHIKIIKAEQLKNYHWKAIVVPGKLLDVLRLRCRSLWQFQLIGGLSVQVILQNSPLHCQGDAIPAVKPALHHRGSFRRCSGKVPLFFISLRKKAISLKNKGIKPFFKIAFSLQNF
ncbi:MAG: hypothetical protein WKG06_28020 [Segetibacter sp.]